MANSLWIFGKMLKADMVGCTIICAVIIGSPKGLGSELSFYKGYATFSLSYSTYSDGHIR